jgi:hypothetical protein
VWRRGFYEAGYELTPERIRYIVAQCRHLRAFAIYNKIPIDQVLPEDAELLASTGPADNPKLQVDVDLEQAGQALQSAMQRRNAAEKGPQNGGPQIGT